MNATHNLNLYQINAAEAREAGVDPAALLDVFENTRAFVYLAERNRKALRDQLGVPSGALDPQDMGPYLAIAHNQGLAAALSTVRNYGMDWEAYKARNPTIAIVSHGYGDDCRYNPSDGSPDGYRPGVGDPSNLVAGLVGLVLAGTLVALAGS